jgi:hypothetical protein
MEHFQGFDINCCSFRRTQVEYLENEGAFIFATAATELYYYLALLKIIKIN